MSKKPFILASLLSLIPFVAGSAQELSLPKEPASVEVPAVPAASVDNEAMNAQYQEIYSALKVYSSVAYASPQDSPQYFEAVAAGQYLRARLEALSQLMGRAPGYRPQDSRDRGHVSYSVLSELNDVFGFYSYPSRGEGPEGEVNRGVPIKQGYCQVNFVKNNVPFLVQYDGFLKKGEIILTFDDGPGPLTEEVSAAMKAGNAPSAFFVLGRSIAGEAGKARIKAEAADGHSVAVHGYNHAAAGDKPMTALSTEEAVKQFGGVKASIKDVTGASAKLFRPPYGIVSVDQLKALDSELGLIPIGWTIDTLDWSTKDPDELFNKTVAMIQQRGKGIVLMDDIHAQSRTASKRLVKWLADNGYTVVSPDRLVQAYKGE